MAFTNTWDETTPTGSDNASTADDFFRKHRLDLGERLEGMFYGFNADSNASPENDTGIKNLKLYKQSGDPTVVTDFGHFYVKLVSGVPELFYQDDENTTLQLTSGGNLKSTAGLSIDGASTLTGAVSCASSLDVTGNIDPTSYETTNGGFLDEDDMSSDSATKVASQQSIKAAIDAVDSADDFTPTSYAGENSITLPNGMVMKFGHEAGVVGAVSFATETGSAFSTAVVSITLGNVHNSAAGITTIVEGSISKTGFTLIENGNQGGCYWMAIGY